MMRLLIGAFVALSCVASWCSADEPQAAYRLGVEDVLRVQAWGRADLGGELTVTPDGKIRAPLLGDVVAIGRTPEELGRELAARYTTIDPRVTEILVTVVQFNSRRVTIIGEVRKPGSYALPSVPTLMELMVSAGGATAAADLSRVQIVRKEPQEGEERVLTVNVSGGLAAAEAGSVPALRAQDTVNVPPRSEGAIPGGQSVRIFGAVGKPGTYALTAGQTVLDVLAASGGPLPDADLSKVQLTRSSPQGVVAYELDVDGHLKGRTLPDLHLRADDAVLVPEQGWSASDIILRFVLPVTGLIVSIAYLTTAWDQ
jgi:polysaccharide export outer membrane protein